MTTDFPDFEFINLLTDQCLSSVAKADGLESNDSVKTLKKGVNAQEATQYWTAM